MKVIKKFLIERPIGIIQVPKDAVCLSVGLDEYDRDEHGERVIILWVMHDWTDPMASKETWGTRFIHCETADVLVSPCGRFLGSVRYEYANGAVSTYHLFESDGKPLIKKEG